MFILRTELKRAYLDWVNNFLTVKKFASHYGVSEDQARIIIELGRELHEGDLQP